MWVVPDVSDKLSYVLAIRDEQTLQKALKPLEQAELYEELKALYAEDAQRRDAATRFGSPDRDAHDRRSTGRGCRFGTPVRRQESPNASGPSGNRAGLAYHARADQRAAPHRRRRHRGPYVRQEAAEALIELNTDGKVNGRYLAVKTT